MSKLSRYFIKLLSERTKDGIFNYDFIFGTKNFMLDQHGRKYWCEDEKIPMNSKHVSIFGAALNYELIGASWFNISTISVSENRSFPFQISWNDWNVHSFELNEATENDHKLLENIFLQMMHEVEQGKNVFFGTTLFIEKNTAYQHMMNADLLDVE